MYIAWDSIRWYFSTCTNHRSLACMWMYASCIVSWYFTICVFEWCKFNLKLSTNLWSSLTYYNYTSCIAFILEDFSALLHCFSSTCFVSFQFPSDFCIRSQLNGFGLRCKFVVWLYVSSLLHEFWHFVWYPHGLSVFDKLFRLCCWLLLVGRIRLCIYECVWVCVSCGMRGVRARCIWFWCHKQYQVHTLVFLVDSQQSAYASYAETNRQTDILRDREESQETEGRDNQTGREGVSERRKGLGKTEERNEGDRRPFLFVRLNRPLVTYISMVTDISMNRRYFRMDDSWILSHNIYDLRATHEFVYIFIAPFVTSPITSQSIGQQ